MRLFVVITLSVFLLSGMSQPLSDSKIASERKVQSSATDTLEADNLFCNIPEEPSLDRDHWTSYLKKNLELDSLSVDTIPAGRYTVLIRFAIDETGKVKELTVLKDPGYCLGERVVTIVSNYRDLSKSPIKNRNKYIGYHIQPITFLVEEENCEELPKGLKL